MVRRAYRQRSLVEVLLPDADKLWDPTLREIATSTSQGANVAPDTESGSTPVSVVCDLAIEKTCSTGAAPFVCAKPISPLTMVCTGAPCVRIAGTAGATPFNIDNICQGDDVTVRGYTGSTNDVFWNICACRTAATTLTTKDQDVKWKIKAPAGNAVTISKIDITFPQSKNGVLKEVKLAADTLFSLNSGATVPLTSDVKKRTTDKGQTEELFHFQNKPVASIGYGITVTYTNGCTVHIIQ